MNRQKHALLSRVTNHHESPRLRRGARARAVIATRRVAHVVERAVADARDRERSSDPFATGRAHRSRGVLLGRGERGAVLARERPPEAR